MYILKKILLFSGFIFLFSCSASYQKLANFSDIPSDDLSKFLFDEYKEKAAFEATKMHDWNSAKLYSEKALSAAEGNIILPQNINYWKITPKKRLNLIKAYDNLMLVYEDSISLDPKNLAKAISSLDCWSEQQEENWQTWDINKCRDDYLNSMHALYNSIEDQQSNKELDNSKNMNISTLITKDTRDNILQIIYFDFDNSNLEPVSMKEIKKFIESNKNIISEYLIVGHADTSGSKSYNQILSLERAKSIKNILIKIGINEKNIKVIGRGEDDLQVKTKDETPHPANRRAEISPLN